MKKINFASMSDAELTRYLKFYCLDVPETDKGKLIRKDAIGTLSKYQDLLASEESRRVRVVFHKTGDIAQGPYMYAAVNGRNYISPFDQEVVVPETVLHVCDNAVVTTYKQSASSMRGQVTHDSFDHRIYPYTIIEMLDTDMSMEIPEEKESK